MARAVELAQAYGLDAARQRVNVTRRARVLQAGTTAVPQRVAHPVPG
jgi:hypothetical protein